MNGSLHRPLLYLFAALWAAHALHYTFATSVVDGGERYFLLWDDAMITMQYAKNLAYGDGLVWVVGEQPVQGITNPGVALVMTVLHWIPVGPQLQPLLFQLVNLACLAAIIVYTYRLARLLFGERAGIGAAAVTALDGPLHIWSLQGSDFGILALVALVALVEVVSAQQRGEAPPLRVFVVMAAGIVVRADFSLVYAMVTVHALFFGGLGARGALRAAGIFALTWGALLGFGSWYYGDPLPNTYYLKATGNPRELVLASGWRMLRFLFSGRALVAVALLAVYGYWLLRGRWRSACALLLGLVLAQHAYYVWVGGDWVVDHGSRYLMLVTPLALVLLAGGAAKLAEVAAARLSLSASGTTALLVVQLVLITFAVNPAKSVAEWHLRTAEPMHREDNANSIRFARTMCAYASPEAVIGLFWAGVPAYHCDRTYVDVLGRSDRHIARRHVGTFKGPGHAKWDWNYVVNRRKADIIAAAPPELKRRPDFDELYCMAWLPDAEVALALRKESRSLLQAPRVKLCDAVEYPKCRPCSLGPHRGRSQPIEADRG